VAHVELTGTLRVAAPPDRALRFFTPDGERLYVPGWDPEYLHPRDGALVEGLTFRTSHGGEQTIWLVAKCDCLAGAIDYVRVTPDSRIGTVTVRVAPAPDTEGLPGAAAEVTVTYRLTSLSSAGDAKLAAFEAGFQEQIASWERSIAALLD
jgi:hypothetical protein